MATFTSMILGATAIAGAGLSAYGQYMQGQQMAAAEEYNKKLYEQQAKQVEAKRGLEASRAERLKRKITGKAISQTAGKGLTPSGSPVEIMMDNLTQMELDKQITDYNLQIEKSRATSGVQMAGVKAQGYRTMGLVGAGATLLTQGNRMYMRNFGTGTPKTTSSSFGMGTYNAPDYYYKGYNTPGSSAWFGV